MEDININEEIKREMQILVSLIKNQDESEYIKFNWDEEFDVIRSNN
ncbi:hypothetical protein [Legionella santicrucis]|nr:hypothetical protein [Legionella santicrucis]